MTEHRGWGLTAQEKDAIGLTVELADMLDRIVGDGPTRDADLTELISHVHAIQRSIMAQAAARAYPDKFRLLGGEPPA
jgi:hypothetical protein